MNKAYHKAFLLATTLSAIFLTALPDLEARGGGGGRGSGGGRGGSSNGRGVNRSPSMSRSNTRSNTRSSNASRPPNRNNTTQRSAQQTRTRSEVQNFLNQPSVARPNTQPASRPGQLSNQMTGTRQVDRQNAARHVRDAALQKADRNDWFNSDRWSQQGYQPLYNYRDHNGWRWATAAGVAGWLRWNDTPYYYDYYPYNGSYYWGPDSSYSSSPVEPSPGYAAQTQAIDQASSSTNDEWMPLGVFALSPKSGSAATPNSYLQLALNKEGVLSGTYYNTLTKEPREIEGLVDRKTQRAAWKLVDSENSPVMETGLYNLTQPETPVMVHFSGGTSQEMLLVRLDEEANK